MSVAVDSSYQSLPALERAAYFKELNSQGVTSSEIARQTGKSLAYVSNTLRLLKLPAIVQEGLVSDTISEGHARALLALKSHDAQVRVYREILLSNANVRQAEELVRKFQAASQ